MQNEQQFIRNFKLTDQFKIVLVISSLLLLYTNAAFASLIPNASTMLENLTAAIPELMKLVTAFAYVLGIVLVFKGIASLKQFGESRSMMSTEHSLKGPLIFIFVGAVLLYLPTSVKVGMSTFWENPNPYGYLNEATTDSWKNFIGDIFQIIELVGVISFVRGMVLLTHLGGSQGQQGVFGRAISHIIGGILCINMYQFLQVILTTLGYGQI